MAQQPVYLNVYDMASASINQYSSSLGVGIYHTGVEIYEIEYAYGGHPLDYSGIFEIQPKDVESLGEETFRFKESILIGHTDFNNDDIRQMVKEMGKDYKGDKYHLLHRNCNHFSETFIKTLCGKKMPSWINRLAYMSTCIPFLEKCIPKEFLIPIALENSIHADDEIAGEVDDEESQSINTTEDDEAMLKESSTSSSSTSSASSSSISCFSPSMRRRGSTSYPNKNKKGAPKKSAERTSLTDSPRLDRPNRPFSNLKRII
ncbi:Desumoylating isopeptidase 2 [Tyrophagus putrescentiae]|nr:Desumoylating isopeptidase 2 [Tyrophagus putrescentiae]